MTKLKTAAILLMIIPAVLSARINKEGDILRSGEIIIKSDSIEICAETFGNAKDPAILLIMGASASMTWWDEEFCRRLSDKGRFVIRYDNRDVGRSTFYEPGTSGYDVMDMTEDAVRVLDYFKVNKAHIAGMSLGGMIAQLLALTHPERISTITMIASGIWDDIPDMPPIDEKILKYHAEAGNIDWTDQAQAVKFMAEGWRLLNGSRHPFDEKRAVKLAETEYKRARNLLSMFNHALLKGGEEYYGRSREISVPALIIHGTEDSVLPFKHAEIMNKTIPNSRLITLEGAGHELHYNDWDQIINAIAAHTGI